MSVTRVGFVFSLDKSWLGGVNYYQNLWFAIRLLPKADIYPIVFTSTEYDLNEFQGLEVVQSKMFNRKSFYWLMWMVSRKIFTKDYLLERLLLKNKIDVLSHYNLLGKTKKIKTVGWIPDFQHVHLQHLFSKKETERRNEEFKNVCQNCNKVIVSSYAALVDLISFSKESESKAEVLQFAIPLLKDELLKLPCISLLEKKHNFRGKYFLLPNQFWIHKNHQVVIDAVSKLKNIGINVQILLTGNTLDPRNPKYFSTLVQKISLLGLSDALKILGIISKKELYALMQNAEAIINPSLFEGWSTTVEEAKTFEKKIILSDIAVHREQSPVNGFFFPPHDADLLAEKMNSIWSNQSGVEEKQINQHKVTKLNNNVFVFAKQYEKIINNL